jgi:RNA-directed DNA polymerase
LSATEDPDDDWAVITSFANLRHATTMAARAKRGQANVARFLERREAHLFALQDELRAGTWRPGTPTVFEIRDPKPRAITAAPFRDRVVHHALIGPLEERFDAALSPHTYACRRGMGTHRALDHAQAALRGATHLLKLDIARCFPSIRHDVVRTTLEPFKFAPEVGRLIDCILAGAQDVEREGLPIGNLTSQWFANLVLGRLDRYVSEVIAPLDYVRYMDDFVLFADGKPALRAAREGIEAFARETLHLTLKERATLLAPAHQGLPFLGWRLYPGLRRVRPENLARCRARLRRRRALVRAGALSGEAYIAAVRALFVHLGGRDTVDLRNTLAADLAAGEHELGAGPSAPRTATTTRRRTATTTSGSAPPKASHA